MKDKTVYIVHSIDTEGPLYESLAETFVRIKNVFGLDIEPSKDNLKKLQNGEISLDGKENQISKMFEAGLLTYNDDYNKLQNMLERINRKELRNRIPDSFGNGWIYNWHCVDHIGYTINPRRKDCGYHNIFDHYSQFIEQTGSKDSIHWHFHPAHWSGASHICATSHLTDNRFNEIISRRIIERQWFPSVNRAGFHTERPDSHWLLEQWIPFDLSNQGCDIGDEQDDLSGGRFGDWRRAPRTWSVYNPSHDDYQSEGECRRYIGRCLNVGSRMRLLTHDEVRKAFEEASSNGKALMGFTNHDFREMENDVLLVQNMISEISGQFPDVKFKFCDAREAFNLFIWGDYSRPVSNILSARVSKGSNPKQVKLVIEASEPIFGPQPYLAIQTNTGLFLHDNFDFEKSFEKWTYTFDYQTVDWNMVQTIGVAANDKRGFPHILNLTTKELNLDD